MISWWLSLLLSSNYVTSLNPIIAEGNMFFDSVTNERFFPKGLAYQVRGGEGGIGYDALSDFPICSEHIKVFKEMGINLIRVYQIDQTKNHDQCMELLEKEGIYVAPDLPDPAHSINRKDPSYGVHILEHYKRTVDLFDKYDNVAFYFAGNEISTDIKSTDASVFVKAGIRDIKAYIKNKKHKTLVGYANLDNPVRKIVDDYLNCGSEEERPDFLGVNIYSWCGKQEYESSEYKKLTVEYKDFGLPMILSEFGCRDIRPREFVQEIGAIFGPMNTVFSGGIVYEFDPTDKFGIVEMDMKHKITSRNEAEISNIKKAFAENPKVKQFKKDLTLKKPQPSTCPAVSDSWRSSSKLPITPVVSECDCMVKKLECIADPSLDYTDSKEIESIFKYLCEIVDCKANLGTDPTKGEYGLAYGCDTHHKLSWALNAHYLKSNRNKDTCTKHATIQTPSGDGDLATCFQGKPDDNNSGALSQLPPTFYLYTVGVMAVLATFL